MCLESVLCALSTLEVLYWGYIGFTLVTIIGIYFTLRSGFYQFKVLAHPIRTIKAVQRSAKGGEGVSPFRVYFASVGGMVGVGNIVLVISAVTIGGPGALFWLWVASFFGMLIKYAEIYLGMKFRVNDGRRGHHGGPMIYLQKAFRNRFLARFIPILFCVLLSIYGIEIAQFVVIMDVVTDTFSLNRFLVLGALLAATLYGSFGGVRRLANISTALMPPFIVGYFVACFYVISLHSLELPTIFIEVFHSAFTGHAAMGGFVGSSMMMAAQLGTARAVYSGDLGIGYDSIIQSESKAKDPHTQACLSIFGVATDTFICTISILVVLVTGIWKTNIEPCHAVSAALSPFVSYSKFFMALLIFIAGYTTIIAYLTVGAKAMEWLLPVWGKRIYFVFAICAFIAFSFLNQCHAVTVMALSGGLLMLTNLSGMWNLRHEIVFKDKLVEG